MSELFLEKQQQQQPCRKSLWKAGSVSTASSVPFSLIHSLVERNLGALRLWLFQSGCEFLGKRVELLISEVADAFRALWSSLYRACE